MQNGAKLCIIMVEYKLYGGSNYDKGFGQSKSHCALYDACNLGKG